MITAVPTGVAVAAEVPQRLNVVVVVFEATVKVDPEAGLQDTVGAVCGGVQLSVAVALE